MSSHFVPAVVGHVVPGQMTFIAQRMEYLTYNEFYHVECTAIFNRDLKSLDFISLFCQLIHCMGLNTIESEKQRPKSTFVCIKFEPFLPTNYNRNLFTALPQNLYILSFYCKSNF